MLYCAKVKTMGEQVQLSEKKLSKIKGLGRASLREVKDKLTQCSPPRTDTALKTGNFDV